MPILLSKTYSNNVPQSPGRWLNGEIVTVVADDHVFGAAEIPAAGSFHHITVTDKTLAEVQDYIQGWNHEPTTTQIANTGDFRTIEVTSGMVSVSGKGAFVAGPIDAMLTQLGIDYPTSGPVRIALTDASFQFTLTAPLAARDEVIGRVNEVVRDMQYARRRWYINQAGRDFLNGNGGVVSGTAAQVAGYLRDGLLD